MRGDWKKKAPTSLYCYNLEAMKFRIKYPNITLLGLSIVAVVLMARLGVIDEAFGHLGKFQYIGALLAGILFPITFTSPIAVAALYYMGEHYGLGSTVIFGAIGAAIGDFIIFNFIEGATLKEIEEIREEHRIAHPIHGHKKRHEALVTLFHTKPFHALAMFIGGLFILLPGPDEVGIAIFSSYKMNSKKFILLSLALNAASVWIVMLAGAKQFFGS